MEFDREALVNIIKTLCGHYGSINKFGKKVDMSPAYLSRVMKGFYKGAPSPDVLRRIANGSDGLFTYIELMYICGYFTSEEYDILRKGCSSVRNPDRIPEILKELEQFWKQVPDWRLGQVISNLSYEMTGNNDPFYTEDDKLLALLKQKNKKS